MVDLTSLGDKIIWIAGVVGALGTLVAILWKPFKNFIVAKKELKQEQQKVLTDSIKKISESLDATIKQNNEQVTLMDDFYKQLEKVNDRIDANEIDRIRWEILYFANLCKRQECMNVDEFRHIVALYDKYEKLITKNNITNGYISIEMDYIKDLYKKLIEQNKLD